MQMKMNKKYNVFGLKINIFHREFRGRFDDDKNERVEEKDRNMKRERDRGRNSEREILIREKAGGEEGG